MEFLTPFLDASHATFLQKKKKKREAFSHNRTSNTPRTTLNELIIVNYQLEKDWTEHLIKKSESIYEVDAHLQ